MNIRKGKLDIKAAMQATLAQHSDKTSGEQQHKAVDGEVYIELNLIEKSPFQPRLIFPAERIQELAYSISEGELINAITVRKHPDKPGMYQIVAGECRYRAVSLLGNETIRCKVRDLTDEEAAYIAIEENDQRTDLTDFERATAYIKMEATSKTKKEVYERLKIDKKEYARFMAFGCLPDYMTLELENAPNLLGRTAAWNIKSYISSEIYNEDILMQVWSAFINGRVEQTKIGSKATELTIKSMADAEDSDVKPYISTFANSAGKKIGKVQYDNKNLTLKVQHPNISNEVIKEIEEFMLLKINQLQ